MIALLACAPPDAGIENTLTLSTSPGHDDAAQALVAAIHDASDSVRVALPQDHPDVRTALEAAAGEGLAVEVVVDIDLAGELATSADVHGYTLTVVDPAVAFFEFGVNLDVAWTGDQVVQSNTWAVIDDRHWWVASGLVPAGSGTVLVAEMTGEDLVRDVLGEHNQLLGGTDATSMDAYNGLNKSLTDLTLRYPLDSGETLRFGFGPQERLVKQLTDAIYRSRGSVTLVTQDLTDPGVQQALADKAHAGFTVEVLVGVATTWVAEDPIVRRTASDLLPTLLVTDDGDGRVSASVLSHPVWSAARIVGGTPVTSDQFVDGVLWSVEAPAATPTLDALTAIADDLWNGAAP